MSIDGHVLTRVGVKQDLLLSMGKVKLRKSFSTSKRDKKVIYPRKQVFVQLGYMIDCDLKISTNPDTPVFLHYRHYGHNPVRKIDGFNDPLFLETFELFLHFLP